MSTASKTGGKAKKTTTKRKAPAALKKKVAISGPLVAVLGVSSCPRPQVIAGLWKYIKKHDLQTKVGGKGGFIKPDDKLAKVFGSSKVIAQTAMMKHVFKYVGK